MIVVILKQLFYFCPLLRFCIFSFLWVVSIETFMEEASNNNWYNFFVIFVNDGPNRNFWPT